MIATSQQQVASMNMNNFVVLSKRKLVEIYTHPEAWKNLKPENLNELAQEIAGLPTELTDEDEEAKRFDLLMLRLQLALLRTEPGFERLRKQVRQIAGLLEENSSIPMVMAQMPLIQDLQADEWWENVTEPILENTRKRLRSLIKLFEKAGRKPLYANFENEIGTESFIELHGFESEGDFEKFRAKARHFLKEHENDVTIHKLRWNMQLTPEDMRNLEQIMLEDGISTLSGFEKARKESHSLGIFIRSLVGMDREAAKQAFGNFITGVKASANQIEFINKGGTQGVPAILMGFAHTHLGLAILVACGRVYTKTTMRPADFDAGMVISVLLAFCHTREPYPMTVV